MDSSYKQGRGAQFNPDSPFDKHIASQDIVFEEDWDQADTALRTQYITVHPKTILNRVESPDIGLTWSMNPYQGCEHGCVYCYARNTHPYWGYSAGLDFESRILVKENAAKLLDERLSTRTWKPEPIMLSGNTDCYQPAEKEVKATRKMLEVLLKHRHPVGIITKNSLILRDLDILRELSYLDLVQVVISINGTDESLRRQLEPRTASYAKRFETVRRLSEAGIPVMVMVAPIIPGLNDHQIFDVVRMAAKSGARDAKHIIIRLNGDVRAIFEDWLEKNFPDRAAKVIRAISSLHGGQVNDSRFHVRMRGEGQIADIISDQMKVARGKFMEGRSMPKFNTEHYRLLKNPQLSLF